jgi:hypothetical protein
MAIGINDAWLARGVKASRTALGAVDRGRIPAVLALAAPGVIGTHRSVPVLAPGGVRFGKT